jgi:hypothetical protein
MEVTGVGFRVEETEVVVDFKVEVVATMIETIGISIVHRNQLLRKNKRNPFQIRR